jgi:DNA-binding transcriptional ArsR family regulator
MAERNVHYFEACAAIDFQAFAYNVRRHPNTRCFVRGDVLVACHVNQRKVLTVIALGNANPRTMFGPDGANVAMEEVVSTADEPTQGWLNTSLPLTTRIRHYLASVDPDDDVPVEKLVWLLFGPDPTSDQLKKLNNSLNYMAWDKLIARPDRDTIRIAALDRLIPAAQAKRMSALQKAQEVMAEGFDGDTTRNRILRLLVTKSTKFEFNVMSLSDALGIPRTHNAMSTVRTILSQLVSSGHILRLRQGGGNIIWYRLARRLSTLEEFIAVTDQFSVAEVIYATGLSSWGLRSSLEQRPDLREVRPGVFAKKQVDLYGDEPQQQQPEPVPEPAPEPEPVPEPAPKPEPEPVKVARAIPLPVDVRARLAKAAGQGDPKGGLIPLPVADSDLESDAVSFGFDFAPLPDVFLVNVRATIHRRIDDLYAHAGQWALVASYDETVLDNAEEVARKNAARVQEDINDARLEFKVMRSADTVIGVFVRHKVDV